MAWYFYLSYFFAGVFLANGIPHFFNGISGRKFPTPFAHPPGKGLSSPLVNVLWGFLNFVVGYILTAITSSFNLGFNYDIIAFLIGVLTISVFNSIVFSQRLKI